MAQHILETDGLVCPFPVVEAKAAMAEMPAGDELVINFDCTQGTEAIPRGRPADKADKSEEFAAQEASCMEG